MTEIDWVPLRKLRSPRSLAVALGHFFEIVAEFPRDLVRFGPVTSYRLFRADLEHWLRRIFQRNHLADVPTRLVGIRIPGFAHRFYFRRNTSDRFIVRQIFRSREYDCLDSNQPIRFFVDGGGNIGATSVYLLTKFPEARAIVIEPDDTNREVCLRNLGPFLDRIEIVPRALWSESAPLHFCRSSVGAGQESAISVATCQNGETADIEGITLDDLFKRIDVSTVDLVKLDVEGAEEEIFGKGSLKWLGRTRNIVIELHGPHCERAFRHALKHFTFDESHSGDLTVCQNLSPNSSL